MSGIYLRCRGCEAYRPRREFADDYDGLCRVCDPPVPSKRCRDCGEVKPIEEFPVGRHCKDGRRGECKTCHNDTCREHWRRQKLYRTSVLMR